MKDRYKTKDQLLKELETLCKQVAKMEKMEDKRKRAEEEIKAAMTILPKHAFSLSRIASDLKSAVGTSAVISNSSDNFHLIRGIYNYSWKNILGT